MPETAILCGIIADAHWRTHANVLDSIRDLTERQLAWRAGPTAPSIAFHLWHLARWADFLHEILSEPSIQLWEREALADRWGFAKGDLGYAETGFGMDDDSSTSLPLPAKSVLLDYVRRAFALADETISAVNDSKLGEVYRGPRAAEYYEGHVTFGYALLRELRHQNRHFGMIECLRGVQGLH